MKEIDPCESTIVINKYYKISILCMRKNMIHTQTSVWIISKQAEARLPCVGNDKDLLLSSLQGEQSKDKWEEENSCILFK